MRDWRGYSPPIAAVMDSLCEPVASTAFVIRLMAACRT
jgi:hypothetical protein